MIGRRVLPGAVLALTLAGAIVFVMKNTSLPDLGWLTSRSTQREPDVIFVPTPPAVVRAMLEVAQVTPDDLVIDLGSGDGRMVIAAARDFGARGIGIEIDSALIEDAAENARRAGVSERVHFLEQDLFQADISAASVVTLYLMPMLNLKLRPKLFRELKPGTRVVSHAFDMGDWTPDKVLAVEGRHVYFWIIPEAAKHRP
jgi:tRNA A58 N-methylase Trm61